MTTPYEKCPKHPQNDIILFCLGGQCIEPLCKECCKEHVTQHNTYNSKAELETVDTVRQRCLSEVHTLKVRFEEERAILKHFSDSENSELIRSAHQKLEQVKQKLYLMVNEYCASLEIQIKQKVSQHRAAHPGEKKELHNRLNSVILDLDNQEKGLLQPKYLRPLLMVLTEEKNHDLEGFATEIDGAVRHYLQNMFDVFVHEDKLSKIQNDLQYYVAVEEASLESEIEIYTAKLRSGEQVYGIDNMGNPTMTGKGSLGSSKSTYGGGQPIFGARPPSANYQQSMYQQPTASSARQSGQLQPPPSSGIRQSGYQPMSKAYDSSQIQNPYRSTTLSSPQPGDSNNKLLKSKYDL